MYDTGSVYWQKQFQISLNDAYILYDNLHNDDQYTKIKYTEI